jgi:hypothetical protein
MAIGRIVAEGSFLMVAIAIGIPTAGCFKGTLMVGILMVGIPTIVVEILMVVGILPVMGIPIAVGILIGGLTQLMVSIAIGKPIAGYLKMLMVGMSIMVHQRVRILVVFLMLGKVVLVIVNCLVGKHHLVGVRKEYLLA